MHHEINPEFMGTTMILVSYALRTQGTKKETTDPMIPVTIASHTISIQTVPAMTPLAPPHTILNPLVSHTPTAPIVRIPNPIHMGEISATINLGETLAPDIKTIVVMSIVAMMQVNLCPEVTRAVAAAASMIGGIAGFLRIRIGRAIVLLRIGESLRRGGGGVIVGRLRIGQILHRGSILVFREVMPTISDAMKIALMIEGSVIVTILDVAEVVEAVVFASISSL
jgi:hypothetical protein